MGHCTTIGETGDGGKALQGESEGDRAEVRNIARHAVRLDRDTSGVLRRGLALRRDFLRIEPGEGVAVLPIDVRFLVARGFSRRRAWRVVDLSRSSGRAVGDILLEEGDIEPELYYRCLAAELDVPFLTSDTLIPDARISGQLPEVAAGGLAFLAVAHPGEGIRAAFAPPPASVAPAILHLARHPEVRASIAVTSPQAMERVRRCQGAIANLRRMRSVCSASYLMSKPQKCALGAIFTGAAAAFAWHPVASLTAALTTAGTVFIATGIARGWAAYGPVDPKGGPGRLQKSRPPKGRPQKGSTPTGRSPNEARASKGSASLVSLSDDELSSDSLPGYSLLVPLYREAAVVGDLVASLSCLDYPHDRLQILLIVEADDEETHAALIRMSLPAPFEIATVPPFGPRTKPKALAYALQGAHGDLVAVYDAEDRPEADQLRKVAAVFADAGPDLGCVQARLAVDHASESFFTRHFALEYALQFDVLLPWMSALDLPFRLGGTSNHIRRRALVECGGWDPYNVTEDLDLGIRLLRDGWRLTSVDSTTWEEAPLTFRAWTNQRIRWHKGWLQTWIVHMRHPGQLLHELGRLNAGVMAAIFAGTLLSLLAHPVFLTLLATYALHSDLRPQGDGPLGDFALGLAASGFVLGYGGLMIALRRAARLRQLRFGWRELLSLPVYWLLMSGALSVAVIELVRKPFHWRKTRHGLARHRP